MITGSAGMIGRKLAARLATDGRLADAPVAQLMLVDVIESERPAVETPQVEGIVADPDGRGVRTGDDPWGVVGGRRRGP